MEATDRGPFGFTGPVLRDECEWPVNQTIEKSVCDTKNIVLFELLSV